MDLFASEAPVSAAATTPLETFHQLILDGDAKGAVNFLRSLNKSTLQKVLLLSGFGICGTYREWINHAATRILDAANARALPRQQQPGDWEAVS